MAARKTDEIAPVQTLVRCLSMDVLEKLAIKLNPRHPLKDFRYLAGKMGYNYEMVKNIERQKNPTTYLVSDWDMTHATNGESKTVSDLIEFLKEMKRDDAVEILRPFEFTDPPINNLNYGTQVPHSLSSICSPVGNLFGAYSTGDLNEKRPAQENEYPYNNNLPSSDIFSNYVGEDGRSRPYQEFLANYQHTLIHNTGSPLAVEPRPPVRSYLQNGSTHSETNGPVHPVHVQPSVIPEIPSRPMVSDKVALVIGNQQYERQELRGLFYAEKDAYDVTQALFKLGFKVVSLINLNLEEMRIAVLSFCRLLGKGVYGVLYYAGHGYEDGGDNFLLPVDADLKYNRQNSFSAQEIQSTMQTCDTALNLLIIDACRIRLPNNSRSVQNQCKRGLRGNNIFAYSCCSQQEAYEEPGQSNGLYALHLLRNIGRDERIELILMDVARDVSMASNRNLMQRPCHESDAVEDCRLTDPITHALPEEYRERMSLWRRALCLPKPPQPISKDRIVITFNFHAIVTNVMEVEIMACNTNTFPLHEVVMDLAVPTPVMAKDCFLSGDFLAANRGMLRQIVQLSRLQKLLDPLEVTFKIMYTIGDDIRDWEVPIRLGCPLVSSVFVLWDTWMTCGRIPERKCTQV